MIHEIDGTIRSVQGPTPGPSSGISYTIVYIESDGSPVVLDGQVPVMRQWPDEIDIDGQACVGKKVHGSMTDQGRIWWFFVERPAWRDCNGTQLQQPAGPSDPLDPRRFGKASVKTAPSEPGFGSSGPSGGVDSGADI